MMSLLRKEYQRKNGTFFSTVVFTVLTALIISVFGNILTFFTGFRLYKEADSVVIAAAAAYGLVSLISTFLCVLGTKYGNVSVLIMFATLGQIVLSSFYGLIFDSENNTFSLPVALGYLVTAAIVTLSFIETNLREKEDGAKNKKVFILFCIALFFINGCALPIFSLFTRLRPDYASNDFLTINSMFGLAYSGILLAVLYFFKVKKKFRDNCQSEICAEKKARYGYALLLVASYSLAYFASDYLSLICTSLIPIVIQAPLSFSISMIILILFDFIIYKEKPSRINFIQVILAVICTVCFAL